MGKSKSRQLVAIKGPKQASHDASATAINKKKFLAALAAGMAPGCAAKEIEIHRSTAYNWKRDDEEFAAQWVFDPDLSAFRVRNWTEIGHHVTWSK